MPAVAGGLGAALLLGFLFARRKKQRGEAKDSSLTMPILDGGYSHHAPTILDGTDGGGYVPPMDATLGGRMVPEDSGNGGATAEYSLAQIEQATDNFSPRCKLAEGAFGAVYRGKMRPSGRLVAIKVLTRKDDPAQAQSQYSGAGSFALEAQVLGKYHHANIVGLLGHCLGDAQPQQFLVYEFMAGGSLLKRLQQPGGAALKWPERFVVASDVARGLQYLHVDATPPIIHQDIKSDNILLEERGGQLVAKIADFGAVRIESKLLTSTHFSAKEVIGTKPYQPPEYTGQGHVSEKTDTFAFGVVLLELLTAKPPSNKVSSDYLYSELAPMMEEPATALPPLLDRRAGKWPVEKAVALAAIAKKCLEMYARKRVAVRDVLVELDVLAGREALVRAGRGQEYDPMTGKLVTTA